MRIMAWRGIPRREIPWYPAIDPEKCTGCRACVDFCRNDVLEFDEAVGKTKVKDPFNCVVECSTCARLCPEGAISFPDEGAWIGFLKDRMSRR
jgi:NAD-dependent dihydropyrimidine dehydrogenase PreA subunit